MTESGRSGSYGLTWHFLAHLCNVCSVFSRKFPENFRSAPASTEARCCRHGAARHGLCFFRNLCFAGLTVVVELVVSVCCPSSRTCSCQCCFLSLLHIADVGNNMFFVKTKKIFSEGWKTKKKQIGKISENVSGNFPGKKWEKNVFSGKLGKTN